MRKSQGFGIILFLFLCPVLFGQNEMNVDQSILNSNEFSIDKEISEADNQPKSSIEPLSLKENLQKTLNRYSPSQIRIEAVSPRTVLLFSLPFGAETTFSIGKNSFQQYNDTTESIYAIGVLCWNIPCFNRTLLRSNNIYQIKTGNVQTVQRPVIQWNENSTINSQYFDSPYLQPPSFNYPAQVFPNNNQENRQQSRSTVSEELVMSTDLPRELIVRIGNDYQKKRGELLAALSFSSVSSEYEIHLDDQVFQIKNLAESEKRRCCLQGDLSQLAIGLSFYQSDFQEQWTTVWNDILTLEKLAKYELLRPVNWANSESTDKLLGLTFLLQRTENELSNQKLTNPDNFQKMTDLIRQYLTELQTTSLSLRQTDGLWTCHFFQTDYPTNNQFETLFVTAHFLRWLILFSTVPLPAERTSEKIDEIKRNNQKQLETLKPSIIALNSLLESIFPSSEPRHLSQLSPLEAETLCVSLHSISLYLQRSE